MTQAGVFDSLQRLNGKESVDTILGQVARSITKERKDDIDWYHVELYRKLGEVEAMHDKPINAIMYDGPADKICFALISRSVFQPLEEGATVLVNRF